MKTGSEVGFPNSVAEQAFLIMLVKRPAGFTSILGLQACVGPGLAFMWMLGIQTRAIPLI